MNSETQLDTPQASNPFASKSALSTSTEVESQRAVAEVQAAMVLARRFPRDPLKAMDAILNACTRPTLAEGALYSYSRGGTDITGPSIRLAEVLAQNWGNIQFGIRELEQRNGESTVEAFAWDLETNVRQSKLFQVPHIRYSKSRGNTKLTDPRDVYELIANNGARRLRACILGVIPGDVTEEAQRQCEVTLSSSADTSPENVKKMLAAFLQNFDVSKEQIEKRIQRRIESIQAAQIVSLKKIYASLKDGMSVASDWFDAPQVVDTPSALKPQPEKQKPVQPVKAQPEPVVEAEPEQPPVTTAALADMPEAWGEEEKAEPETPQQKEAKQPAEPQQELLPPEKPKAVAAPEKWQDVVIHLGEKTIGKKLGEISPKILGWFQKDWRMAAEKSIEDGKPLSDDDAVLLAALKKSIQPSSFNK